MVSVHHAVRVSLAGLLLLARHCLGREGGFHSGADFAFPPHRVFPSGIIRPLPSQLAWPQTAAFGGAACASPQPYVSGPRQCKAKPVQRAGLWALTGLDPLPWVGSQMHDGTGEQQTEPVPTNGGRGTPPVQLREASYMQGKAKGLAALRGGGLETSFVHSRHHMARGRPGVIFTRSLLVPYKGRPRYRHAGAQREQSGYDLA